MEQTSLFANWSSDHTTAREKNLLSFLILLAGLLVGSLFVDVAQLFTGTGFSGHAIRTHSILETGGKTWVAYTEPKVGLKVITDSNCADCNPDEALTWLRRIVPTVDAEKVEATSPEGKSLLQTYTIQTLPSFIFDKNVSSTDFYTQAAPLFTQTNGHYFFDMGKIGLPVGKYLAAPPLNEDDIQIGKKEAPVKFIVFTDFDCQYCRAYHSVLRQVLQNYGDRVLLVVKHLPLPNHPQAENAALASACANDQGKFQAYADILFGNQGDWDKSTGTQRFKNYSFRVPGMNTVLFASCLDTKKHAATVDLDLQNAQDFNVSDVPSTFINTEFVNGAAPYPDVQVILDRVLGK